METTAITPESSVDNDLARLTQLTDEQVAEVLIIAKRLRKIARFAKRLSTDTGDADERTACLSAAVTISRYAEELKAKALQKRSGQAVKSCVRLAHNNEVRGSLGPVTGA